MGRLWKDDFFGSGFYAPGASARNPVEIEEKSLSLQTDIGGEERTTKDKQVFELQVNC